MCKTDPCDLANGFLMIFNFDFYRYHLFGVISHVGSSLKRGHYVAHVRSSEDDKWNECDDDFKGTVGEEVMKDLLEGSSYQSPYLLFYRKIKDL